MGIRFTRSPPSTRKEATLALKTSWQIGLLLSVALIGLALVLDWGESAEGTTQGAPAVARVWEAGALFPPKARP